MPNVVAPTPEMRVLCRDAEWLVTRVDPSDHSHRHYAVHCIGADDLVRGHAAIFLTQLDTIEPVDPRNTQLVQDQSSGYRMAKLFLEAQLRQMPATGVEPDLEGMGVFKPMKFQIQTVEWALRQLRPRLLLADAVGLGKTIQVGMVLSELMRRGRANRVLVLARKSMLTQFQSELWNRFGFPLVRLDSAGIAKLRLRIPANKNPFEVYQRVIISIDTLKNVGSYRHFLENTRWDCVVIDEAHNVAGASVPERHLAYRLARLLSRRTHHQCHNIIHYDLPWSIITLIQRNGRIDRFGQTENPVLRYLRVSTRDGMLKGDESIFERLVEKVEEINRSTRQGETVLKLYDPEAEERYIAEAGILKGNVDVLEKPSSEGETEATELESVLSQANPTGQEDFLKFLLGEAEEASAADTGADSSGEQNSRLRLYDDKHFLLDGYRYLAELNQDYAAIEENGKLMLLNAPKDLRRRLGAPNERGDVVFGATAIPVESWPEDNQFRLSDDPDRVELAIKAARNTSGHWSRELLATDQHPILQWITERLLMLMKRGECPHITSRSLEPGELCFCFIGQVSSRAGAPLVVDAHAISFRKGGGFEHRSLRDALDAAGFDKLANEGNTGDIEAIRGPLVEAAVESSLEHMRELGKQHVDNLLPYLRRENRRLRNWKSRRVELLESRIAKLPPSHRKAKMYRKDLEEMDAYLRDREDNWQDTYFTASTEPSTQLVLVIEGVG
jgi:hypothetical protein